MGQSIPTGGNHFEPPANSNSSESDEDAHQTVFDSSQNSGSAGVDRTINKDADPEATVECLDQEATQIADPEQTLPDGRPLTGGGVARPIADAGDPEATIGLQDVPDTDREATIDCDIEQTIVQQWHNTITDENAPDLTLKSDPNQTMILDFDYSLKEREVAHEDKEGDETPDYVREHLLGEGGIGQVYSARQQSINRQVAIKILKKRAARRDSARDLFVAEGMITGELDHPAIVPVYDLALEDAKTRFYVMKQVQGIEWADRIHENSLRENLDILLRVADAIAMAHSRWIIHRDLKPANVMLGEFGEVLVMDWGLAAPTSDNPRRKTLPRARFGGTPSYMAPEMASGPVDVVDRRSDVYLLGAILFEILTGSPPHTPKTVKQCLIAAANNEISDCSQTGLLVDTARKAMATSLDERHQSVSDFQGAVRVYFQHLESISLAERPHSCSRCFRLSPPWEKTSVAAIVTVMSWSLRYPRTTTAC